MQKKLGGLGLGIGLGVNRDRDMVRGVNRVRNWDRVRAGEKHPPPPLKKWENHLIEEN